VLKLWEKKWWYCQSRRRRCRESRRRRRGSRRKRRRGGGEWGVGITLPSRLGVWGSSYAPPLGFGAEPRPKTSFGVSWAWETHLVRGNLVGLFVWTFSQNTPHRLHSVPPLWQQELPYVRRRSLPPTNYECRYTPYLTGPAQIKPQSLVKFLAATCTSKWCFWCLNVFLKRSKLKTFSRGALRRGCKRQRCKGPNNEQNMHKGFKRHRFTACDIQGGPKKRNPGFNFAITSVNVHRF